MSFEVSHSVEIDRARKLIDVRLSGPLSPEDIGWIGEDVRAAIRSLGQDVGRHVTLYDASQVPVVPGATIDLMMETFDHPQVRAMWARKVAFVVSTALGRMQVKRLQQVREDFAIFDDREEALAWLLAD